MTTLISATELITRYYSNEKLAQCCFNVRPTSATLADIKTTFGECVVSAGKADYCQYAGGQLFPDTHGNIAFCVTTQSPHERNGELFRHRCRSSYRVYMTWELALNAAMGMKRI